MHATLRSESATDLGGVSEMVEGGQPGPGWWLANDGNWYPPSTTSSQPPASVPSAGTTPKAALIAYGSSVALILSGFLTWYTFSAPGVPSVAASGTTSDPGLWLGPPAGYLMLLVGMAAAATVYQAASKDNLAEDSTRWLIGGMGVGILVWIVISWSHMKSALEDTAFAMGEDPFTTQAFLSFVKVTPGVGLFLAGAAGIGLLVSAFRFRAEQPPSPRTSF